MKVIQDKKFEKNVDIRGQNVFVREDIVDIKDVVRYLQTNWSSFIVLCFVFVVSAGGSEECGECATLL